MNRLTGGDVPGQLGRAFFSGGGCLLLGFGGLIDKVHQTAEVDAAVVGQAHFAGARGGVAILAPIGLQML